MTSHKDGPRTAGPWSTRYNGFYWQIDSEAHGQICDLCASNTIYVDGNELSKEQTALIAAANASFVVRAVNSHDELVEALKAIDDELTEFIDGDMTCDHSVGICCCGYQSIREKMRSALAKVHPDYLAPEVK